MPDDEYENFPGLARAAATNSATLVKGAPGKPMITIGTFTMTMTARISRAGL